MDHGGTPSKRPTVQYIGRHAAAARAFAGVLFAAWRRQRG